MAGKKSKTKGSTYEREVCKLLGDALGGSFVRTNASGAFIGGTNNFRKSNLTENQIRSYKADIFPPEELSRFVIECKHYQDIPYHRLVQGLPVPIIDGWLEELEHDCDEDDVGMLIFKADRKGSSIMMKVKYLSTFDLSSYTIYGNWFCVSLDLLLEKNAENLKTLGSKPIRS